jgi:hypothetical protein
MPKHTFAPLTAYKMNHFAWTGEEFKALNLTTGQPGPTKSLPQQKEWLQTTMS